MDKVGDVNVVFSVEKIDRVKKSVTITAKGFVLGREYFWYEDIVLKEGNTLTVHQEVKLSYE